MRFKLSLMFPLLLCACQGTGTPPSDAAAGATPSAPAEPATPAATASAAKSDFVPFDSTPIGIESCDAFIAFSNHCFATSKQHPSTAKILRPAYEEQFRQWRSMKDSPSYQSSLKALCDTHMEKGLQGMKDGLLCE